MKALLAMKAAWDTGEECCDPARKEDILGRTSTCLDLWEEHLKNPIVILEMALECLENPYLIRHLVSQCVVASPCRRNGVQQRWCEDFANPFVSAETLKACALIGLHLLAVGGDAGSSGSQSPDLGDTWKYGCSKSRDWDGNVESWTESEGPSSSEQCEHNVESLALNVMEQDWVNRFLSSWKIGNLEGWH